jgi:hypothetical protein
MKDFLDENLAKGDISWSNSLWSTPAFFIKKTGGGFHPIFDYQHVNDWTTKMFTPYQELMHCLISCMEPFS